MNSPIITRYLSLIIFLAFTNYSTAMRAPHNSTYTHPLSYDDECLQKLQFIRHCFEHGSITRKEYTQHIEALAQKILDHIQKNKESLQQTSEHIQRFCKMKPAKKYPNLKTLKNILTTSMLVNSSKPSAFTMWKQASQRGYQLSQQENQTIATALNTFLHNLYVLSNSTFSSLQDVIYFHLEEIIHCAEIIANVALLVLVVSYTILTIAIVEFFIPVDAQGIDRIRLGSTVLCAIFIVSCIITIAAFSHGIYLLSSDLIASLENVFTFDNTTSLENLINDLIPTMEKLKL